jgi:hypothetical protein
MSINKITYLQDVISNKFFVFSFFSLIQILLFTNLMNINSNSYLIRINIYKI